MARRMASKKSRTAARSTAASRTASADRGEAAGTPGGAPGRADPRRFIYAGLDLLFATVYAVVVIKVIPNRLPIAQAHLYALPFATAVMGIGMIIAGRWGWRLAAFGSGLLIAVTILLILRILISAAFLAGVYGAFGQAASTFSLVAAAIVVEMVGLLPLFQLKFLMTRAGKRCLGVDVSAVSTAAARAT